MMPSLSSVVRIMCSFLILLPYSSNGHSPHDVIAAIATSEDGQTVFTSSRGILLKSEDGGINWLRTMKGMYCLEGTCGKWTEQFLVTSPNYNKDETVFSGTKKYGLQKSIDGGFNWLPIGHPDENEASGDGHFKHCLEKGHFTLSPKFGDTDKLVLVIGERHNRFQEQLRREKGVAHDSPLLPIRIPPPGVPKDGALVNDNP